MKIKSSREPPILRYGWLFRSRLRIYYFVAAAGVFLTAAAFMRRDVLRAAFRLCNVPLLAAFARADTAFFTAAGTSAFLAPMASRAARSAVLTLLRIVVFRALRFGSWRARFFADFVFAIRDLLVD